MKYDVFISSKSEDYGLAEKIYDFLTDSGLDVFLASRELDRLGESEYSLAIDDAIDNSKHLIVVATSVDNINSKWVKYEWNTFSNDLKSGYRSGNIITILSHDIELRKLPASLRHQQSFWTDSYKQHILSYLKDESSVLAAKLKEAYEEIERLKVINKSKDDIINYLKKSQQDANAKIKELTEAITTAEKKSKKQEKPLETIKCSHCGHNVPQGNIFCNICGHRIDKIKCSFCGQEIDNNAVFCYYCGKAVPDIKI